MSRLVISSFEEFEKHNGQLLGHSEYHTITQEQINEFGKSTLDMQWIHTDPERCKKESPFGAPIAHGYLTLSLLPHLWKQIIDVQNYKLMVNYGIENLRFTQPVPVNSEVRLKATLKNITNLRGIVKCEIAAELEIKDEKKPAYAGVFIFLYHFN